MSGVRVGTTRYDFHLPGELLCSTLRCGLGGSGNVLHEGVLCMNHVYDS